MVVPGAMQRMRWQSASLSDVGQRRRRNEDALLVLPESSIFAVADGMGGHAAGDVASRLAVESLAESFATASDGAAAALSEQLSASFAAANAAIVRHAAENAACFGMGTTLTAVSPVATGSQCVIGHIGDSRVYRLRAGELEQLTRDHTWVQQQLDAAMLTPRQARDHPWANVLTRVLGTPEVGEPDVLTIDVEPGDLFLLCTDGLIRMIDDPELHGLLDASLPLEECARVLIDTANRMGGIDNATVILLRAEAA